MRTINLKLHKPSSIKKKIIDEALINYNAAYRYLLLKAHNEIDCITDSCRDAYGKYRALSIARWVDKDTRKELSKFGIEPFKDSLELDFGMTLAGYLNYKENGHSIKYPLSNEFLHEMKNGENQALRPLYFCRYSTNRDYCLLYDSENGKYYAKLYLMNNKNKNKIMMKPSQGRRTEYISKSSKVLETSSSRVRFILIPLSFGKWQEEYLKIGLENPGIFKTARLQKKGSDYFLTVNLDMAEPVEINQASFMGVSRGFKKPLNFSVSDKDGNFLKSAVIELPGIMKNIRNNFPMGSLHKIANSIVNEAVRNRALVVVEQLVNKGDRLQWENEEGKKFIPVLGCREYNLIVKLLEYKLPAQGLPAPVKVSSTEIFYTCPQCGMNTNRNRSSHDMFICTACGKTVEIEILGSINLSRRLADNKNKLIIIKAEKTDTGIKLINSELGLACNVESPLDITEILTIEISRLIKNFYSNIKEESVNKSFNKKISLIKKLQQCDDIIKMVEISD
jgi:putative transposase